MQNYGKGNGNPLQYSCLENPMDREAWQATVHGVTKNWTWLKQLPFWRSSVLGFLWREWCWSWNCSTLATSCEELTRWKRLWCWEGLGAGGEGMTEDEMAGWHHWLDGCESQWTLGVGNGQGGLVCCDSWGREESDTTERLNWTAATSLMQNWFNFIQILCIKRTLGLKGNYLDNLH